MRKTFWLAVVMALALMPRVVLAKETCMDVYGFVPVEDAESQLYADVLTLDLDIAEAEFSTTESGWAFFETTKFRIGRKAISGDFVFVDRVVADRDVAPAGPVETTGAMERQAMEMMAALSLPIDEIREMAIHRVVDQSEDSAENLLGETETTGFVFYASRQVDGFPVEGSRTKALFDHSGELVIFRSFWPEHLAEPIDCVLVASEETLRAQARDVVDSRQETHNVTFFDGVIGYSREIENNQFTPAFIFDYALNDGFLLRERIDGRR